MTEGSPQPQPHGRLTEALLALFAYMDRPWRVVAVVVLAVLGGAGWVFYQHQAEFIEQWLTPTEIELKVDSVPDALGKLTEETDADLVQIWSVDLASNSQWFLGARRHDGERPVIPKPRRLPIFVTVSDVKTLISALDGNPVCVDLMSIGSPLARRLVERGMKRGCAIPIRPGPAQFVGVIYLAWRERILNNGEETAIHVGKEVAAELVTR